MKTFLVYHSGALGDFVLAWPSLSALRSVFCRHLFIGIGRPKHLALALKLRLLDQAIDVDGAGLVPFFSGEGLPEGLSPPDGAVLWLKEAEPIVRLLERKADLPVLAVPPFPEGQRPIARYYLDKLQEGFGIPIDDSFRIAWPDPVPPERQVLIHPGSGSPRKHFPFGFYLRLANLVHAETGLEARFVLGPVEIERGGMPEGNLYPMDRPRDLITLAEGILASRLFIGNDSGVSHLAGILGVPTIAFYRETDPAIWGVMGREVYLIHQRDEEAAFADFRGALAAWGKRQT